MAKLDVDSFFRAIESDPLPPVIAMGGEERTLHDDALQIVRRRALEGGLADFNHDRVKAKSAGISAIINAARTLPTMAPRRLVEVEGAEDLGEDALVPLENYLKAPVPEAVLLFNFGKLDLRQKVGKLLSKHALTIRFEHPKEREMPRLVQTRARRHELYIDDEVAEALAVTVGTDLGFLERALEKLALVTEGRTVTLEAVSEHVADTHLEDAFAFGAALAASDRALALKRLHALEQNRAAPLQLMGLVAWQLRQVIRARSLLDEGVPPRDVTAQLKAFGPRAQALIAAAKRFEPRSHARRLGRLGFIDQSLKSSRANGWRWMERMVLELCPPQRSRRG